MHARPRLKICALAMAAALPFSGVAAVSPAPDERPLSIGEFRYAVPTVQLVREDGKRVSLPEEMNDGRVVVLNFVFTSCSSICPLLSQVFSQVQAKLGEDRANVHLMSISVDPEQDTPVRLREYARKFHAGPGWQHYTGTIEASLAVQRAFNVWRGDKMSHSAVTFIRSAPNEAWQRIDGFATADDLVQRLKSPADPRSHSLAAR